MRFIKHHAMSIIIASTLMLLYSLGLKYHSFDYSNAIVFDWQSKNFAQKNLPDPNIIVIAIDDKSLVQMSPIAGRWVWPRSVHAELLEAINQLTVSAVVFDILFAEKDLYRPDADRYFNDVLAESSHVFFSMLQQNTRPESGQLLSKLPQQLFLTKADKNTRASFVLPLAIEQQFWQLGTINIKPAFDGVTREYDVRRNIAGWQVPSLPAKVVSALNFPLPVADKILLQWRGDSVIPFKTLSYVDVYRAIQNNELAYLEQLNNKIILIGATASGLFDARNTPLSNELSGVYMLATAIDNLKNQRFLTQYKRDSELLLGIILILLVAVCFAVFNRYSMQLLASLSLVMFLVFILMNFSSYLLEQQRALYIGGAIFYLLFTFIVFSFCYGYLEYRDRQRALAVFGRFLDPKVVNQLFSENKLEPNQLNKKQVVTVLFSDIRNFTQYSEEHSAEEVVQFLNQYFSKQVDVIFQYQGTLDKFIGDCIMAFWGAPLSNENHAESAINAALAMEEMLLEFRETLPSSLRNFDVGFGLHTGEVIVGMIGAELRADYTVIGDVVNVASRIEGLTKNNSRVLVSEQTKIQAEHAFDFTFSGEYSIKGRASKVKLYQAKRKLK